MGLSKSKLMQGLQCEKNLWLSVNRHDLMPPVEASTQKQFDEGNEVGIRAREWWGEGRLIDVDFRDIGKACDATKLAILEGATTIYEGSFAADDLFARVDILHREDVNSPWQLIEVKKTTSVKDQHVDDVAIQAIILKKCGLEISSYHLMHLNNECTFPDLSTLFDVADISGEVKQKLPETERKIAKLKSGVKETNEPKLKIGPHCESPYECQFKAHCWKHIPEQSIFTLPGIGKKKWTLLDQGIITVDELNPDDFTGVTSRAIAAIKKNARSADAASIKNELKKFKWPLYFLDFETVGPAIPRYTGCSPYSQTPFQLSCHVWRKSSDSKLEHFEFLHLESSDPRPGVIKSLLENIGPKGSIVAYNQKFEIGVISALAEFDEKNREPLLKLTKRFVDPLPIFRSHVYDAKFAGSFSIKTVAPAILGESESYSNLSIQDGGQAQVMAEQLMMGMIQGEDREKVIGHLLEYCRQDTRLLVDLVRWLIGISGEEV